MGWEATLLKSSVIRLWIVMSEEPTVNDRRHKWVKEKQANIAQERKTKKEEQ